MTAHAQHCPICGWDIKSQQLPTFVAALSVIAHAGRSVRVSPFEIDIFELLLDAYPRAIRLDDLCKELYGPDAGTPRQLGTLRVHVANLRKAFRDARLDLSIMTIRHGTEDEHIRCSYALALSAEVA